MSVSDTSQVNIIQGAFNAYTLRFTSNTSSGCYRWNQVTWFNGGAGFYEVNGIEFTDVPDVNNTYTLGASGHRWIDIWCSAGLNSTSHSDYKRDITPIEDIAVPRGITFKWKDTEGTDKDRTYMGFLADDLPTNAFAFKTDGSIDNTGIYQNAVIGILCAAVKKLEDDVNTLTKEVNALVGAQ